MSLAFLISPRLRIAAFAALAALVALCLPGAAWSGQGAPVAVADPDSSVAAPPALPFLSALFTDDMVLQRGRSDAVWGWASPGSVVTARIAGRAARGVAGADRRWTATLPPLPVGGPYTLTVTSARYPTLKRSDILVGDVWLCSGQSNMQWGVGNLKDAEGVIADSQRYSKIRLFYVPASTAPSPQLAVTGGPWDVCSPAALRRDGSWNGFSAVAYLFGRDVYEREHVPIGLISTSVGGTPAEAWTSLATLAAKMPGLAATAPTLTAAEKVKPAAYPDVPGELYNTMIHPLIPFGIKGVIWYQGESNYGRGWQYRTLLPVLIGDWRRQWGQGAFPFLVVQVAGWGHQAAPGDSGEAEVRDAQQHAADTVPNTGLATTVDIGDPDNIHPVQKEEAARRLALVAERQVYDAPVQDSGPRLVSVTPAGAGALRLAFAEAPGGLMVHGDGPVAGFAVAGDDHRWSWADAKIDGDSVTVSAASVPHPVAVRYAWADWLPLNLYNRAGLPALPFRTDDWKLTSQP